MTSSMCIDVWPGTICLYVYVLRESGIFLSSDEVWTNIQNPSLMEINWISSILFSCT